MRASRRITVEEATAYARVRGCSPAEGMSILRGMKPPLRSRIIRAALTQGRSPGGLHDPIEDEPLLAKVLKTAEKEAEASLGIPAGEKQLGSCHQVWQETAEILLDRYGITWFSPAEMNPCIEFD